MLEYDPTARITAEEALQHPYFVRADPAPTANVLCMQVRDCAAAKPTVLIHLPTALT
jgi:hypothetical protein